VDDLRERGVAVNGERLGELIEFVGGQDIGAVDHAVDCDDVLIEPGVAQAHSGC
jgi:hypothetical protein